MKVELKLISVQARPRYEGQPRGFSVTICAHGNVTGEQMDSLKKIFDTYSTTVSNIEGMMIELSDPKQTVEETK